MFGILARVIISNPSDEYPSRRRVQPAEICGVPDPTERLGSLPWLSGS